MGTRGIVRVTIDVYSDDAPGAMEALDKRMSRSHIKGMLEQNLLGEEEIEGMLTGVTTHIHERKDDDCRDLFNTEQLEEVYDV